MKLDCHLTEISLCDYGMIHWNDMAVACFHNITCSNKDSFSCKNTTPSTQIVVTKSGIVLTPNQPPNPQSSAPYIFHNDQFFVFIQHFYIAKYLIYRNYIQ